MKLAFFDAPSTNLHPMKTSYRLQVIFYTMMDFPDGYGIPIGVVTISDSDQADVEVAISYLKKVIEPKSPIVITSSLKNEGMEEIRNLVNLRSTQEMKQYLERNPSPFVIY